MAVDKAARWQHGPAVCKLRSADRVSKLPLKKREEDQVGRLKRKGGGKEDHEGQPAFQATNQPTCPGRGKERQAHSRSLSLSRSFKTPTTTSDPAT